MDLVEVCQILRARHLAEQTPFVKKEDAVSDKHQEHIYCIGYEALGELLQQEDINRLGTGLFVFMNEKIDEETQQVVGHEVGRRECYELGRRIHRANWEQFHRKGLETNPNKLQLITYGLLTDELGRIAVYERLKYDGGEVQLTGKLSLGYGGHLTGHDVRYVLNKKEDGPTDIIDTGATVVRCMINEFEGEVWMVAIPGQEHIMFDPECLEALGYIYLPNENKPADAGNYHLGLLMRYCLYQDAEIMQPPNLDQPEAAFRYWVTPEELAEIANDDSFEPWSREIAKHYEGLPERLVAEPALGDEQEFEEPELHDE
jgi:predicted NUDIX family phosphoesterase